MTITAVFLVILLVTAHLWEGMAFKKFMLREIGIVVIWGILNSTLIVFYIKEMKKTPQE